MFDRRAKKRLKTLTQVFAYKSWVIEVLPLWKSTGFVVTRTFRTYLRQVTHNNSANQWFYVDTTHSSPLLLLYFYWSLSTIFELGKFFFKVVKVSIKCLLHFCHKYVDQNSIKVYVKNIYQLLNCSNSQNMKNTSSNSFLRFPFHFHWFRLPM